MTSDGRLVAELVNLVVDNRITQPVKINVMFDRLPEGKRRHIAERHAPK